MYLDANDAAALVREEFGFGLTADELARLARNGYGPSYRRLDGRRRLYQPSDIRQWARGRLGPVVPTRDMPIATHNTRSQLQ